MTIYTFPNSVHFTSTPSTNLTVAETCNYFGISGNTIGSLAGTKYCKANSDTSKGITMGTFPAASAGTNESMSLLASSWRQPYFTITTSGFSNLASSPAVPIGFGPWAAGSSFTGYVGYGYTGTVGYTAASPYGSISAAGSITANPGNDRFTNSAGTGYIIRQWMYSGTNSNGIIRISYSPNPSLLQVPTNLITGVIMLSAGTIYTGTLGTGVQENQSGDLSTYWTYTISPTAILPKSTGTSTLMLTGLS